MARIRTVKPEFFTSEDIVSLSPLARLLYIAIWCEADKEGRLAWKPKTFKLRYLPADDCDVDALCAELITQGVVRLYGDGLAYVPSFSDHQHINPRESASTLPAPNESPRVRTRRDASARVNSEIDPQAGREGKGREGKEIHASTKPSGNKTAMPSDFCLSDRVKDWAAKNNFFRLPEHFEAFKLKAQSKSYKYSDWDSALMNAIREDWAKLNIAAAKTPKRRKQLGEGSSTNYGLPK